ncbi:hypothetical protein COCOBI_03-0360 [Coccomyxa sp. Obi]|nr:hypothetical protein COCOBI_03-0360 [Coccomyxa sp. Obi]
MYSKCKSVFPGVKGPAPSSLLATPSPWGSRQVMYLGYPSTAARSRKATSSRVLCSNGHGGGGGCPRGAGKFTTPEEPGQPRKNKALAGKLTFEEVSKLAGPTAFVAGLYCLTRGLDLRAVGQGRDYRGSLQEGERDSHALGPPPSETRDTFSLIMMAVVAGAGASNATGESTTTTIISGIAAFSMAVWASSRRRKGVRVKDMEQH